MGIARSILLVFFVATVAGRAAAAPSHSPDRTAWWRDARFGMFIHWGLYAIPADGEWHQNTHRMQVRDYEPFAARFQPEHFDARAWVKAARDAGMAYIIVTAKHHDGFSMFDTKQSDYNVARATPWRHDPMKDLAAECRRQGMRLGFYYSLMDWHHPDYLPRREWEKDARPADGADMDRYIAFVKAQLTELLTHYGPVAVIWFDGGWEHTAAEWHAGELLDLIHRLQPATLVNDRSNLPGDFTTPEQRIPVRAMADGRLWETCMTMNNSWGYARADDAWKPPAALIRNLADVAGKGGNFLLNVGPTADGEFPPEATERLAAIGRWMRANGASIRGTEGGPFDRLPFDGRVTRKGNTLYAHVFERSDAGLKLTGLETPVVSARALVSGETLSVTATPGGPLVARPSRLDPADTVVEIKLNGAAVVAPPPPVAASPDGLFTLTAEEARIEGDTAQLETRGGRLNIGYWTRVEDTVSWTVEAAAAGEYRVEVEFACDPRSGGTYTLSDGASAVAGRSGSTGGWDQFRTVRLQGTLRLPAGRSTIRLTPKTIPNDALMNLRQVTLQPVGEAR